MEPFTEMMEHIRDNLIPLLVLSGVLLVTILVTVHVIERREAR